MAGSFISSNPYGLYRGETMLRLADFELEREFKVKESLAWFEKAIARQPGNPDFYKFRAESWTKLGNKEKAAEDLAKARAR